MRRISRFASRLRLGKAAVNPQPFVDRLLENENVTGDLEDPEAKWLLDWGVQQIPVVIRGQPDAEAAGERVNALMAFLRGVSRLAARKDARTPEALAAELATLSPLYARAFGRAAEVDIQQAAARLEPMSTLEAVQALTTLFQPG